MKANVIKLMYSAYTRIYVLASMTDELARLPHPAHLSMTSCLIETRSLVRNSRNMACGVAPLYEIQGIWPVGVSGSSLHLTRTTKCIVMIALLAFTVLITISPESLDCPQLGLERCSKNM